MVFSEVRLVWDGFLVLQKVSVPQGKPYSLIQGTRKLEALGERTPLSTLQCELEQLLGILRYGGYKFE